MRLPATFVGPLISAMLLLAVPVSAAAQESPVVVVLSPATAVNEVNSLHTVTATASTATGEPAQGITIRLRVTGTRTLAVACGTDSSGQCTFTYSSPQAGTDTIEAYADVDGDATQDPSEPSAFATKVWIIGPPNGSPQPLPDDDDDADADDDDSDESAVDGDDSDVSS